MPETLQRIIFYLTILHSNKNSVIAFEEPEAHVFPYYVKFLAERITFDDKDNQFFISTHNPYFAISIIEKTMSNDINVFLTYLENYQTKVKALTQKQIEELLDLGAGLFFNIETFLE